MPKEKYNRGAFRQNEVISMQHELISPEQYSMEADNYPNTLQAGETENIKFTQHFVNISASGIGLFTDAHYKKDYLLKLHFNLAMEGSERVNILAKVVRVVPPTKKQDRWIGASFLYRCEQEKGKIIKYLFKRQREKIRA